MVTHARLTKRAIMPDSVGKRNPATSSPPDMQALARQHYGRSSTGKNKKLYEFGDELEYNALPRSCSVAAG